MIRVLVLSLYSSVAASTRYRFIQFAPYLKKKDIGLCVHPLLSDKYLNHRFNNKSLPFSNIISSIIKRILILKNQNKYDCIILQYELFPFLPGWVERKLLKIPYIYDFDDAFYLRYKTKSFSFRSLFLSSKFDAVINGASMVTAGNAVLKKYAERLNLNVSILPTVVDTNRFVPIIKSPGETFNIGWIGSPSTSVYLNELIKPLSLFGIEAKVIFTVIGGDVPHIPNIEVKRVDWSELTEVDYINTFDVGVMPLPDNEWAQGKCAFKLIQYMACSIPVIASPVGANCTVVDSGSGLFADSPESWINAFRYMSENSERRKQMGRHARKRIIDNYSIPCNTPILEEIILSISK
jgi:glycosyltransferase involved in cell wall biosynthesis